MKILGIIPARFGSSRFPGKPLAKIKGKPMIQWVYEGASSSGSLFDVVVATDNEEIFQCVEGFGGKAIITLPTHPSGTDRCLEALSKYEGEADAVINIQGDEPFVKADMIDDLAEVMSKDGVELATLVKRITEVDVLLNPNKVKVVLDRKNRALFFSRSPIPFYSGLMATEWIENHNYYKHIGIYGYSVDALREVTHMESSSLEKAESLEQLRWLENGKQIICGITKHESPSVDTPEDLAALIA